MILKYVLLLGRGPVITNAHQSVIYVVVGLIHTSNRFKFFCKLLEVSPSANPKLYLLRTHVLMPHARFIVLPHCTSRQVSEVDFQVSI